MKDVKAGHLKGEILVDFTASRPRESRLHVFNGLTGELDHAWYDAQVHADAVRHRFPHPIAPIAGIGRTTDAATGHAATAERLYFSRRCARTAQIDEAIATEYRRAEEAGLKPPNLNEIVPPVTAWLREYGLRTATDDPNLRPGREICQPALAKR